FDRIGANHNAYTSEENTVYYASVLPEYLPQAMDLVANLLMPSLRPDDFNVEKDVIINEIGKYHDQPFSSALDQLRQHYFGTHWAPGARAQKTDSRRCPTSRCAPPTASATSRPTSPSPSPDDSTGARSSAWPKSTARPGPRRRRRGSTRPGPTPPATSGRSGATASPVSTSSCSPLAPTPARRSATPPTCSRSSSATAPAADSTGNW